MTRIDPTFSVTTETVKADIFKFGHHLPTMSMEEWGGIVMEKTRAREAREKEQAKSHIDTLEEIHEKGEEDNEEKYDLATMRRRAFDDWADGVPKGSGVTKRI